MGATDPAKAAEGTIRKELRRSIGENPSTVPTRLKRHAQESLLFSDIEVVG